MVALPLILATLWWALRSEFRFHKKIARWTFPIWLYVSVTGVIVFFMLRAYTS
jgi:putative membrane protein